VATQTLELKATVFEPQYALKTQQRAPETGAARLLSLDAYRGFIMLLLASSGIGLAVLKTRPNWAWLAYQVDHSEWEGCTFWDLIQSAFTFMVGAAMPFALARRQSQGATAWDLFRHVAWRALLLIALSNIYSNWGPRQQLRFQLSNVLS
jgi:heparan-alpha-glucosaminide N-acetyltransferase